MSTQNNKRKLDDAYRPTFDPHLDIATVVFSHVQCVKTRHSLARVSKLWRDASKPAAAYPLRFDFDAFPQCTDKFAQSQRILSMLDNDEALSLPYERVVGLLGEAERFICDLVLFHFGFRNFLKFFVMLCEDSVYAVGFYGMLADVFHKL